MRRFGIPPGTNATFWSDPAAAADAGLAFDAANQILYVSAIEKVLSLDSAGNASFVSPGRIGAGPDLGLALEPSGTLLSIAGDGIVARIDPSAHTYTPVVDLGSIISNWNQFRSIDVNPETGEVVFSVQLQVMPTHRQLWAMNPDGSNVRLIADGVPQLGIDGPLNVKWGRAGDLSGAWSMYMGLNESEYIIELRPHQVPEPSSFMLASIAAVGTVLLSRRFLVKGPRREIQV